MRDSAEICVIAVLAALVVGDETDGPTLDFDPRRGRQAGQRSVHRQLPVITIGEQAQVGERALGRAVASFLL